MHQPVTNERIEIAGVAIDNVTMAETIALIESMIASRRGGFVVTPNVDHVVKLQDNEAFRAAYRDADLVLADGVPLIWASRFLKTPLKEKVSGSDLFPRFCEVAGQKGYRLFFLGGMPGAADRAAEILRQKHPQLEIGTYCPPFGFEKDEAENEKIIAMVREFSPDVLFVGVGAPKQELWMHRHCRRCEAPVSLGIGASFDFLAGFIRRAPRPLQKVGLEWAWRLILEPRRMYRRYLIEDPRFFKLVWNQRRAARNLALHRP